MYCRCPELSAVVGHVVFEDLGRVSSLFAPYMQLIEIDSRSHVAPSSQSVPTSHGFSHLATVVRCAAWHRFLLLFDIVPGMVTFRVDLHRLLRPASVSSPLRLGFIKGSLFSNSGSYGLSSQKSPIMGHHLQDSEPSFCNCHIPPWTQLCHPRPLKIRDRCLGIWPLHLLYWRPVSSVYDMSLER